MVIGAALGFASLLSVGVAHDLRWRVGFGVVGVLGLIADSAYYLAASGFGVAPSVGVGLVLAAGSAAVAWRPVRRFLRGDRDESAPREKSAEPLFKGHVERFEQLDWAQLSPDQFDFLEKEMLAVQRGQRLTTIDEVLTLGSGPRLPCIAWLKLEKCSTAPSKANGWRFSVRRMEGIVVSCTPFAESWGPPPSWPKVSAWHHLDEMQSTFLRNEYVYNVFLHVQAPIASDKDVDFASFEVRMTDDNGTEVVCTVAHSEPLAPPPGVTVENSALARHIAELVGTERTRLKERIIKIVLRVANLIGDYKYHRFIAGHYEEPDFPPDPQARQALLDEAHQIAHDYRESDLDEDIRAVVEACRRIGVEDATLDETLRKIRPFNRPVQIAQLEDVENRLALFPGKIDELP